MAVLEIPVRSDLNAFKEFITIEGVVYIFQFYFNQRTSLWFADILDDNENPILVGIPVQTNIPLNLIFKHLDIPKGLLFAFDIQGKGKDADASDFGDRVLLLYEETENA
jgi:hypothetical protein